jgi:hypothetical protein
MQNGSLIQGQNDGRDDSVWMRNITYAAVKLVRFMNPKIRTQHQRPKNTLTQTPFDRCCIWKAEVEMMYKVSIPCTLFFQPEVLLDGEANLEVLSRVG